MKFFEGLFNAILLSIGLWVVIGYTLVTLRSFLIGGTP